MLKMRVDDADGVIYLEGEMDLDCADDLREAVGTLAMSRRQVVLDFGGVTFIDSSGTGIFVRLCLDQQAEGIAVRARELSPAVNSVFEMLKVRMLVGDEVFV
jgi:anti-anti-sigma factor